MDNDTLPAVDLICASLCYYTFLRQPFVVVQSCIYLTNIDY